MCHSPFKITCTKFAPKRKREQKQNPENRDGFGVFVIFEIIQIISWRTGEHGEQPSSRTSFFPSFWGRGSGNRQPSE